MEIPYPHGQAGRFAGDASIPGADEINWDGYVAEVESAARTVAPDQSGGPTSP